MNGTSLVRRCTKCGDVIGEDIDRLRKIEQYLSITKEALA